MSDLKIKFLKADGKSPFQNAAWPLPTNGKPGEWLPAIEGDVGVCVFGYHATDIENALQWANAVAFEVESQSEWIAAGRKLVTAGPVRLVRELAWNERSARLFACDCAERVLPIFEKERPNDSRVRNCIGVARDFANGKASHSQMAAARAAAWDAAWDAVWDAVWDAARDAVWAAARAAARDAARAAVWDAARAAARAAARDAARAAVWDAARDAARDAEKQWQSRRLLEYLNGEVKS